METWQGGPSYNSCLTDFEIFDVWDQFCDKHDKWDQWQKKDENKISIDCKGCILEKKAELMAQAHVASKN